MQKQLKAQKFLHSKEEKYVKQKNNQEKYRRSDRPQGLSGQNL